MIPRLLQGLLATLEGGEQKIGIAGAQLESLRQLERWRNDQRAALSLDETFTGESAQHQ